MGAEYSVGQIRRAIARMRVANPDELELERMLTAYADLLERIEADESAEWWTTKDGACPITRAKKREMLSLGYPASHAALWYSVPLFTRPPAQAAQVEDKVVVIREGQATTEGLVLAAAIYMGAVKDIFALRSDGPPYNERKVTRDDAALRAFDHLDAATKALRSAISHFAPTAEPIAQAGADGGVGIDCVSHSPDAADSGRVTPAEVARLIEMCGDAWKSMNAYTDQFDKGSKGVASVEVSAIVLVNWCQVIAMATRGLRDRLSNENLSTLQYNKLLAKYERAESSLAVADALLSKSLPHVQASAGASHLTDGFRRKEDNALDLFVREIQSHLQGDGDEA